MADPSDAHDAALGRLLRGYCRWQRANELVAALRQLGGGAVDEACQQLWMERCYHHPAAAAHPPPAPYRQRVLQAITRASEQDGREAEAALTEALTELLCSGAAQDKHAWGWKTFFYGSSGRCGPSDLCGQGSVSLLLSRDMLAGSTGCVQWEAGLLLGQLVLSQPQHFAGKACLELGCGAGLVGVCLLRAGAAAVTLTDGSPQALANCRSNVAANCGGLPAGLETLQLRWGEPAPAGLAPEVLLGADLLYDPSNFAPLVRTLAELLARRRGAVCFLACCERSPGGAAAFKAEARAGGLQLESLAAECASSSRVAFLDACQAACPAGLQLFRVTADAASDSCGGG